MALCVTVCVLTASFSSKGDELCHGLTLSLVNTALSDVLIGYICACNYVILYPNLVVVQFACIGWHLVPQLSPLIFDGSQYRSIY